MEDVVCGDSEADNEGARRRIYRHKCASLCALVVESTCVRMVPLALLCCVRVNNCIWDCFAQSFDDSDDVSMFGKAKSPKKAKAPKKEAESPAEASKDQIAAIEAELRKILKDEANYDMSYAGRYQACCSL